MLLAISLPLWALLGVLELHLANSLRGKALSQSSILRNEGPKLSLLKLL
jgi:hypothetical protein